MCTNPLCSICFSNSYFQSFSSLKGTISHHQGAKISQNIWKISTSSYRIRQMGPGIVLDENLAGQNLLTLSLSSLAMQFLFCFCTVSSIKRLVHYGFSWIRYLPNTDPDPLNINWPKHEAKTYKKNVAINLISKNNLEWEVLLVPRNKLGPQYKDGGEIKGRNGNRVCAKIFFPFTRKFLFGFSLNNKGIFTKFL